VPKYVLHLPLEETPQDMEGAVSKYIVMDSRQGAKFQLGFWADNLST
jgi:hypothetical protein